MKFFIQALVIFAYFPLIYGFGGLTRLRIQQETVEKMSKEGKQHFEKFQEAMSTLDKLNNQIHGIVTSNIDEEHMKPGSSPRKNPLMYQGDMILGDADTKYLIEEAKLKVEAKKSNKTGPDAEKKIIDKLKKNRAFKKNAMFKWTFPIPYFIDSGVNQNIVDTALKNIEKETCVRFQKTGPFNDKSGLRIFKGSGCYSTVGRSANNKPQDVSIGKGCEVNGIVQHEVCHALGLYHEQARPDRDNYITVDLSSVPQKWQRNYVKNTLDTADTYGIPYDYGSHMQYDKMSFADGFKVVMTAKTPVYTDTMGQTLNMHFNDAKLLNIVYCKDKCKGGISCNAGGYENPNICGTCKCPFMLGGPTCNEVVKNPPQCGGGSNILKATSQKQTFKANGIKNCVYLINADNGKKIRLTVKGEFIHKRVCQVEEGTTIKFLNDKTINGAAFCNRADNVPITSEGNQVYFNYIGHENGHYLELTYQTA